MFKALLALPLLALAGAALADPPDFPPTAEHFSDAGACRGRLQLIVDAARSRSFDAVEGPYVVADADVRAHTVRADGFGHRIDEYRCAGADLSARSWLERLDRSADGAYSIESLATAEWLEQGSRQ
jgi:hypothetical protein